MNLVTSFYDDTYLGPGVVILENEDKFLKICSNGELGFPKFFIRAFDKKKRDKYDQKLTNISFVIESSNELFDIFLNLYEALNGDKLYSVDKLYEGKNCFEVKKVNQAIVLSINKDIYGVQNSSDYIDIALGDNDSCKHYIPVWDCYNKLVSKSKRSHVDIGKMLLKNK